MGSDDINSISNEVANIQAEANSEIFESLMEGLLPKIKVMIPKAIKNIDEDTDMIVKLDEIIIIGRSEEDGSVVVMRGSKDDIEITADPEKLVVNDLSQLFEVALDLMAKAGK